MKEVALLENFSQEEFKLNVLKALNKSFRFLKELFIGLWKFFWLVMVLLVSFVFKRLVFISKLFRIVQSVNKRPQFCVIG